MQKYIGDWNARKSSRLLYDQLCSLYTDVLKVDPLPADAEETWAKWETILSALDKGTTENIMKIQSTSDKSVVSDFKSVNCTEVVCGGK